MRYAPYQQELRDEKLISMAGTRIERRLMTDQAMFEIGTTIWRIAVIWDEEGKPPRVCGNVPANNRLQPTPESAGETLA